MKHLIFDFDGVLANSFEFHLNKFNELYNIGLTAEEYKNIHDGNFYDSTLEKLANINFDSYARQVAGEEAKLPLDSEAKQLLIDHAKVGKNYLVTAGWRIQISPFLKNHNIEELFTRLLFRDEGASKKEKLNLLLKEEKTQPEDCLFITDTLGDLLEAEETAIPTLGVTFGFHSKERLQKGNPTYIATSWREVRDIVNTKF